MVMGVGVVGVVAVLVLVVVGVCVKHSIGSQSESEHQISAAEERTAIVLIPAHLNRACMHTATMRCIGHCIVRAERPCVLES